jgi:hypothetical protein
LDFERCIWRRPVDEKEKLRKVQDAQGKERKYSVEKPDTYALFVYDTLGMLWARLALATGIQVPFMNRRYRMEFHKKASFSPPSILTVPGLLSILADIKEDRCPPRYIGSGT